MGYTGTANLSATQPFEVTLTHALTDVPAMRMWSPIQASKPYSGGFLCLGNPYQPLSAISPYQPPSAPI